MQQDEKILYQAKTSFGSYSVVDKLYNNRPARLLLGGDELSALSGIALDDKPELLFDYNQRFMELIADLQPQRVLLIGGGAYTLPIALMKKPLRASIDVVEPDALLEQIAVEFFGLVVDERLRIFHNDGYSFLQSNEELYDMIIVDAFDDLNVPTSLVTPQAVRLLHGSLEGEGVVAMNFIATYETPTGSLVGDYWDKYVRVFDNVHIFQADGFYDLSQSQNFLLMASKGADKNLPSLRTRALPRPSL